VKEFVDRIARRYARALYEAAEEKRLAAKVAVEIHELDQVISELPELARALLNPAISRDQRISLAEEVGKAMRHSPVTMNFLKLLVKNSRVRWIHEIAKGYQEEFDKATGTIRTEVITAKPLASHLKIRIQRILQDHLNAKRVILDAKVDPEILGGMIVRVKDRIYDLSVVGYLNNLKRHLVGED